MEKPKIALYKKHSQFLLPADWKKYVFLAYYANKNQTRRDQNLIFFLRRSRLPILFSFEFYIKGSKLRSVLANNFQEI